MTEPIRILDETVPAQSDGKLASFERELLSAGKREHMAADRHRALVEAAALGTLAALPKTMTAIAAAKKSVIFFWLKVFGFVAGVATLAAVYGILRSRDDERTTRPTLAASASPMPVPSPPVSPFPSVFVPPFVEREAKDALLPLASPPAAPSGLQTTSRPQASAPPSADAVASEAAMLDRAREAAAHGDAAGALRLLAEHKKTFVRPSFAQEAFVVRVDALAALGDMNALERDTQRWLLANASSPYAARVRRTVERARAVQKPAGQDAP